MSAERRPGGRRSTRWEGGYETNGINGTRLPVGLITSGTIPGIDAIFASAFAQLGNTPFVCAHVKGSGLSVVFGCSQHPRLGLMCDGCMRRHIPRHDPAGELTCDRCGDVVDRIHGIFGHGAARSLRVRRTRGGGGLLSAPVVVVGAGLCMPCHEVTSTRTVA